MRSNERVNRQRQWEKMDCDWKPWWIPAGLYDFVLDQKHSEDFRVARSEYLRSRILTTGLLFVFLTPLWMALDFHRVATDNLATLAWLRLFMMWGFLLVLVSAYKQRFSISAAQYQVAALVLIPGVFFLGVNWFLPDEQMAQLPEYAVIPLLLIALLSIFPLTLTENLALSLTLIGLKMVGLRWSGLNDSQIETGIVLLMIMLGGISAKANYAQMSNLMRLYRQACVDPLTGLKNRGVMLEQTKRLQAQRQQDEVDTPVAVLVLDLDLFKRINDTYGHTAGDLVLKVFADFLKNGMDQTAIKARFGGEEFVVIMPGTTTEEAYKAAERIRREVEQLGIKYEGRELPVTVSIGVTDLASHETFDAAFNRADSGLYQAKEKGRNQSVLMPAEYSGHPITA